MIKYVNEDKPIIFKNETDSDFNVDIGIIFRKSGIYEISINDNTTTVTKISERKTGKWIAFDSDTRGYTRTYECSECGSLVMRAMVVREMDYEYCPYCGSKLEEAE